LSVTAGGDTTTYAYWPDGTRASKTETGSGTPIKTVYFGPVEIRDDNTADGHGSEILTYQHPNVRRVDNVPNVLHKDQLGSVKMITGFDGNRVKHSTYEPFGEANDTIDNHSATSETKGFIKS
jgi:hypothetical protein